MKVEHEHLNVVMGVVKSQSIKSSISLYIGIAVGAINTIFIFPHVFENQPDHWGLVQLLIGYAIAISTFSHLGAPQIYNRFFPVIKKKGQLLFFSILLIFLGFLFTSIAIVVWQDNILSFLKASELLKDYFLYVLLLVCFISFYNVYASVSRSYLESTVPIFLNEVFLRLYTLAILVIHGFKWIDFHQFVLLTLCGYLLKLTIIFIWQYLKNQLHFEFSTSSIDISKLLRFGVFVVAGNASATLVSKIDLFMIGALMNLEDVAYYSIAFFIGSIVKVPARSIGAISIPLLAKAWERDDHRQIKDLYTKSSINQLILGGLFFLCVWVNIDSLFELLPEKFACGKQVVFYIGLAQLFNIATGVNGSIIINSKYYKYDMIFNLVLLMLTIGINYMLIPIYGIDGAAMATAMSVFVFYSIKTLFVYFKMKMHPFTKKTFYTITTFLCIYFLVDSLSIWGENIYISIFVKSCFIILSFIPILFYLNLSKDLIDLTKEFLRIKKMKE